MTSEVIYRGNLRTEAIHQYSGHIVETDAPLDNQGLAERFSPTDLVATALGSCMLTIMGIVARNHEIQLEGTSCTIEKIMQASPRKIAQINVVFQYVFPYTDKELKLLENAAMTCPVFLSLASDIEKNVKFIAKEI
jgi:uncharacterized OsmC-like protein